ncbi:MAG: hypothetical protein K0Q87_483 [Neobacillus sp.]|nr:hypothetical protein [Neobacillus sp.]
MARKTRYRQYAEGLQKLKNSQQKQAEKPTGKSLLQKLKELKGQEFRMTVPIGGTDGEKGTISLGTGSNSIGK